MKRLPKVFFFLFFFFNAVASNVILGDLNLFTLMTEEGCMERKEVLIP